MFLLLILALPKNTPSNKSPRGTESTTVRGQIQGPSGSFGGLSTRRRLTDEPGCELTPLTHAGVPSTCGFPPTPPTNPPPMCAHVVYEVYEDNRWLPTTIIRGSIYHKFPGTRNRIPLYIPTTDQPDLCTYDSGAPQSRRGHNVHLARTYGLGAEVVYGGVHHKTVTLITAAVHAQHRRCRSH